jgi:hypothetical protein
MHQVYWVSFCCQLRSRSSRSSYHVKGSGKVCKSNYARASGPPTRGSLLIKLCADAEGCLCLSEVGLSCVLVCAIFAWACIAPRASSSGGKATRVALAARVRQGQHTDSLQPTEPRPTTAEQAVAVWQAAKWLSRNRQVALTKDSKPAP